MINIDAVSANEEIYADFDHSHQELSIDPPTPQESAVWGEYSSKPVSQSYWEDIVATTINELAAVEPTVHRNFDLRPYVKDSISGANLLVDSGAAVTVWPAEMAKGSPNLDAKVKLKAVNGSYIDTFGKQIITVQFVFWTGTGKKYVYLLRVPIQIGITRDGKVPRQAIPFI